MVKRGGIVTRGDIFSVYLSEDGGDAGAGTRPVLVIQNDVGNRVSDTVIVASITSRKSSRPYPVNVVLPEGLLRGEAEVRLNQIHAIDKRRLGSRIGHLPDPEMSKVDHAIHVSLGLPRQ